MVTKVIGFPATEEELKPRKITIEYPNDTTILDYPFVMGSGRIDALTSDSDGLYTTADCYFGFVFPQGTIFPSKIEFEVKCPADNYNYLYFQIYCPTTASGGNRFRIRAYGDGTNQIVEFERMRDGTSTVIGSYSYSPGEWLKITEYLQLMAGDTLRCSLYINDTYKAEDTIYSGDSTTKHIVKDTFFTLLSTMGTYGARLRNLKISFTKV